MGVKSDLAIAFSKEGWEQFQKYMVHNLASQEQDEISDTINAADTNCIHNDGSHLLFFESVKSYHDDMSRLLASVRRVAEEEHYVLEMSEDGTSESFGSYLDNPFGIATCHSIGMNTDGCTFIPTIVGSNPGNIRYWNLAIPVPATSKVVNDKTCPYCKNDKCSSQEKSCWKCGGVL